MLVEIILNEINYIKKIDISKSMKFFFFFSLRRKKIIDLAEVYLKRKNKQMSQSNAVFSKRTEKLSNVKTNLRISFREEQLRALCVRVCRASGGSAWVALCMAENIFRGMRKSRHRSRIQDGSMTKTNREEKSCNTPRWARGGQQGGQGKVYPCGNIARVHTWPGAVQQLRLQTVRRRQGMKRGGKTSAERRIVVGHHGCRA